VADRASKRPFPPQARMGAAVCARARAHGALLRPLGDVVVLMPPLAIDLPLLDRLGEIVHTSIHDTCSGPQDPFFVPSPS
jgi:adenosylmethionine-8-amino-7-oxononanoate aminotransferase